MRELFPPPPHKRLSSFAAFADFAAAGGLFAFGCFCRGAANLLHRLSGVLHGLARGADGADQDVPNVGGETGKTLPPG